MVKLALLVYSWVLNFLAIAGNSEMDNPKIDFE